MKEGYEFSALLTASIPLPSSIFPPSLFLRYSFSTPLALLPSLPPSLPPSLTRKKFCPSEMAWMAGPMKRRAVATRIGIGMVSEPGEGKR